MICPKCGKESVKDALYCEWCGTQLNQKKTVICPKCGREGIKNALYCEWCGAQLNQKEIPSNRNMEKYVIYNSKSKFLWLVFASICGVGGGLFILGQSREELAEYHITGSGRFLTGNPDGLIIVGWLCIILFGAFLLFLLLNYKNCAKRPWFVLNSDGFYSYSTNSGFKGMIGWNEIRNFHIDLQNNSRFLVIEFITKNEKYESTRKYAIAESKAKKKQKQKTVRIFINFLGISDKELIETMHEFQEEYQNKNLYIQNRSL